MLMWLENAPEDPMRFGQVMGQKTQKFLMILWMEEILHQLIDGLSHCNPIIYNVL